MVNYYTVFDEVPNYSSKEQNKVVLLYSIVKYNLVILTTLSKLKFRVQAVL